MGAPQVIRYIAEGDYAGYDLGYSREQDDAERDYERGRVDGERECMKRALAMLDAKRNQP